MFEEVIIVSYLKSAKLIILGYRRNESLTHNRGLPSEAVDFSNLLIDCLSEFKGVKGFKEFFEGALGAGRNQF